MPKVKITSSRNHMVYCKDLDELFDTMQSFEAYLMKEGLKPFVKIGSVYQNNNSFDFRLTTEEVEEKNVIYQFFNMEEPKAYSNYRLFVSKGGEDYYYPLNDLKTTLILYKVLEREMDSKAKIEVLKYFPQAKGGWIVWKDHQGRTAKDIKLQMHNEELNVDIFSTN